MQRLQGRKFTPRFSPMSWGVWHRDLGEAGGGRMKCPHYNVRFWAKWKTSKNNVSFYLGSYFLQTIRKISNLPTSSQIPELHILSFWLHESCQSWAMVLEQTFRDLSVKYYSIYYVLFGKCCHNHPMAWEKSANQVICLPHEWSNQWAPMSIYFNCVFLKNYLNWLQS